MNLYTMVGAGIVSPEASTLRTRLAMWHDAMVAHERKIRTGRTNAVCDEECPHAEARDLWVAAVATFGDAAHGLTFLRARATGAANGSTGIVPPAATSDVMVDDYGPNGAVSEAISRPSSFMRPSERAGTATAEA